MTALMLFAVMIFLGMGLRLWLLNEAPFGIDSDQARVLFSGAQAIQTSNYRVYADEATRFEAFSTYLFAASEKWFGDARLLSTVLSVLDLFLLALLLHRQKFAWEYILAGVTLLACSPFAIYYARVAGPCVGASTILLGFLLLQKAGGRLAMLTLGLFYYSIFRLVWIYELLAATVRRDRRRFLLNLVPLSLLMLASAFVHDLSSDTKFRGLYNFDINPAELFTRVFEGLGLWLWSPSARMAYPTDAFVMDPVSQGFAWLLGSAPAMGLGFSMLLLLAFVQFGQDLFAAIRRQGFRSAVTKLPGEVKFFLFAFAALMLSPTYSHAIFLVPLTIYFCLLAFQNVAARHQGVYWAVLCAVILSGWTGMIQAARMVQIVSQPGQFDQVYGDRLRLVFENRVTVGVDRPTFFFSATQFYQARYWASRLPGQVNVLPALEPNMAIENMKLSAVAGQTMNVYFDTQVFNENWMKTAGAQQTFQKQNAAEALLKERSEVLKFEQLTELGQPVARFYLVRWR